MNKKFHFVMMALMMSVLSLTACDGKANEDTSAQVGTASQENAQMYTVGVDAGYPPYDFRDEYGHAMGFDVDIIKAIGEKQGFGVNIITQDWHGLLDDFGKGVYDISIAGYENTSERTQKYLVSRPYSMGQDVVVTKKGGTVTQPIKTMHQLKALKVAIQENTTHETRLKSHGINQLMLKNSSFLAFQAVARGEADAMVVDKGVAQYYIQQLAGGANTAVEFEFHQPEGGNFGRYALVILAPKGKEELMQKIDQGIVEIIQDGTYTTIYKKWFGTEPDVHTIPKI